MKIRRLHLENFRGIKAAEWSLDNANVTIYGANGAGKTTIANAISYLFTDQAATGEKDFSPKTEGTHNLNHVVELTLDKAEEGITTYSKDFHEVWKKKRGSKNPEFSGHETDYSINGVPAKKKEFDESMETLCGGDAKFFSMLSKVGYFAEDMKMDDRRKILFEVCGDMSDDEVIEAAGLQELNTILLVPGADGKKYAPEEYLQIAKAKRKEINKKIDEIPARIDELSAMVVEENTEDSSKRQAKIQELEGLKEAILSTPQDTKVAALRAVISGLRVEMDKAEEIYLKESNEANKATMERVEAIQKELSAAKMQKLARIEELQKVSQTVLQFEARRAELLKEFEELKGQKWDPEKENCPYCGQSLPIDKINELRHNFLEKLANEKQRINNEGKQYSKDNIEKLKKDAGILEAERDEMANKIEAMEKEIAEIQQGINKPAPFKETQKYLDIKAHIEEVEENLRQVQRQPNPNEADLCKISDELRKLREEEAAAKASEGMKERIAELEASQGKLGKELDTIDKHIHLVETFYREKVAMVTKKIDDKFKNIKFLLFKDQINGGLKEVCEPLIPDKDGNLVEYKSANTAAQINAGLEIIQVLSEHYNVYLPVIIDRAESYTSTIDMPKHQVIKLTVSAEDKELRVVKG